VVDPDRPSLQRDHQWADEMDARDPQKREQHRLRITIGISGWLSSPSDVNKPWEVIDAGATEPFALRFELDAMLRLGTSLQDVLFSYAWDGLTYTVVSRTLLGALYAGLWPLGLIKVASVLDNPFSVALARADKAGKVLAHALIDGVQGKRPVSLLGYSVGARVIYACLVELAEQHAFGLVESVVMMGAPVPSDSRQWRQIRSVVAARVVNAYSTEDYVLGYLYRSTKLEMGVAGLAPVKDIYGIENVDVSKLVSGHDRYRYLVGTILAHIDFGDLNFNKIADQERALESAEMKKQRMKEEAKRDEAKASEPTVSPTASTANPTTTAGNSSQPLVNLVDEPKLPKSQPRRAPQPQGQRPAFYSRSNSKQQPAPRKMSQRVRPTSEDSLVDPLGSANVIEAAPTTIKKAIHPTATALQQSQTPSTLIFDAEHHQESKIASLPHSYGNEIKDGPITLIDSFERAAQTISSHSKPKMAPAITVTQVVADGHDVHAEKEGDNEEEYDDLADEIGSEFGELTMVEPLPLDDFDYGLM
jgi:hypothetical protein